MNNCKKCNREAPITQALCNDCLNNWLIMRQIIQKRLTDQYGEATRETGPIMQREINRLDALWRRDRDQFKKEANQWYKQTPTP
jgi:hypothetical protein